MTSQREASEPGYVEICKASDPAYPVTGVFTFTASIFTFTSGPIMVPVGDCSGGIQVPSGNVTITETPKLGILADDVTAIAYNSLGQQIPELISWTEPDLNATVGVQAGDVVAGDSRDLYELHGAVRWPVEDLYRWEPNQRKRPL